MSDGAAAFVRGFGDLAQGRAGLVWSIDGGGAVALEGGQVTAAEADAVQAEAFEGWSFEAEFDTDSVAEAAIVRHVAIQGPDGATIICLATGAPGLSGHGEEQTSAVTHTGGERIPYEEALISTQYDGAGDPTRIGLELWPAEADQTSRAAATRVSGSLLGGARSGGAWAGFFRCHTGEAEGLGTYLLWRA